MHRIVVLFLLFVFGSTPSLPLQSEQDIGQDKLKAQLADYTTIAVGWFLNKRCTFLADPVKSEFDLKVAATTVGLNRVLASIVKDHGKTASMLISVQKQAEQYAVGKYKECNKEAEEVVIIAMMKARSLAKQLKKD